ncbi:MAG: translation initiation factor IF-6 [Thermoplasmatales archaeon]
MIQKARIFNSPFLGVFIRTWEKYTFYPKGAGDDIVRMISTYLKTEPIGITIGGSNLVGSLCAMNSNGIVVGRMVTEDELKLIPENIRVGVINDKLNATGNNILVNDRIAMVHEEMTERSIKIISDVLGVEVVKGSFKSIKTIGSSGLVTNKGIIRPPNMSDEEIENIGKLFGVRGSVGTANFGSMYIGASVVSNSNGALIGEDSTTVEISNIEEALGL